MKRLMERWQFQLEKKKKWTFVRRPSGNLKPCVFALLPLYKLSMQNLEFTIFILSAKKLVGTLLKK